MKSKKKELDVDFIGGTVPLSADEEKLVTAFIQRSKSKGKTTSKKSQVRVAKRKVRA